MGSDDDIARLLPEPPPPRPVRREAAIGAALRRFDGVEASTTSAEPRRPPVRSRIGRVQIGAFASVALVALIGVPAALTSLEQRPPVPVHQAPALAARPPAAQSPAISGSAAPASSPERLPAPLTPVVPTTPPAVEAKIASPVQGTLDKPARVAQPVYALAPMASPPPAPPPPVAAPLAAQPRAQAAAEPVAGAVDKNIVVTGSQLRRAAPSSVAGVATVTEDRGERDVVVTGTKVRGRAAASAQRGDWNACTINDPNRSLPSCRARVNPGAKGPAGTAAAHLADGLSLAWDGDMDGAIAAFGQAIALQPRLALAYLNRGLAHQRQGQFEQALADLDRAVRYAPGAAWGYYNRAQLLRQHGDNRRADADEERAVELDPDYEAVVK